MTIRMINTKAQLDEALNDVSQNGDYMVVRDRFFRIWTIWENDRGDYVAVRVADQDEVEDRAYYIQPSSPVVVISGAQVEGLASLAPLAVLWWPGSQVLVNHLQAYGGFTKTRASVAP